MEDLMLNMEKLQKEVNRAIKELAASKNLEERIKLSELIKNLSDATGVYFNFASEMMMHDMEMDDEEFDDEEFDDEKPF